MNLLFDLDGTLTDPFRGITRCIAYALERLGRQPPPRTSLGWCIGPPLKKSFARLLASEEDGLIAQALALYRERFSTVGLYENKVYDGIPAVLARLQTNGHALFVATSKPRVYAERIVDHFALGPYFRRIYGSELDGTRSEKALLIAHILREETLPASEVAMIGDRKHDMLGAKANGVRGLGVLWGYGTKDELEISGAHACVARPGELASAIEGTAH